MSIGLERRHYLTVYLETIWRKKYLGVKNILPFLDMFNVLTETHKTNPQLTECENHYKD